MKPLKKIIILVLIVAFIILMCFIAAKYVFLTPIAYSNSNLLSLDENNQIKTLITDSIAERHSSILKKDIESLYTKELINQRSEQSIYEKSIFVIINSKFMKSCKEINKNEYEIKVDLSYPDFLYCYFTISKIDDKFIISKIELDM